MSSLKYQDLTKVAILYAALFFSKEALAIHPWDLEGPNLVGPKSFTIAKHPKYDWEEKNPQGSMQKDKANPVDYFTKIHPELLEQASKNLSNSKKSFIIKKDDSENSEYEDQR